MNIAEKYEKLRLQRLHAVKKWNANHRDKVNEYNRKYQAKLYAEKKANKDPIDKIVNYKDKEAYKEYQAGYRITKRLRQMPFFGEEILY
jgi:hypothetical protein